MFTTYEVYFNNGTANMEKAGVYKNKEDAINTAKIYHNSIVMQADKIILKHSDGWTDYNTIFKKDGDKIQEYIY